MGEEQSDGEESSVEEFYLRNWIMDEEQLFHLIFFLMYIVPIIILSAIVLYWG
jgi:hypothetical protein